MSSTEEQAETTPTAAILSLPRFSTAAVTAWFQRAEVQFRLKRVVQSRTKADHVLASIPEEVFPRLSDWLEEKGDHLQYEELKEELLRRFTSTPEEKVNKLLDMAHMPLGDERPSDALDEMRRLAKLPSATMKQLDIAVVLWLTRLPDTVRQGITDFAQKSPTELGDLANSLMATFRKSQSSGRACAAETSSEDEEAVAANCPPQRRKFRPPSSDSNRAAPAPTRQGRHQDAICQYHRRFGKKARKCTPPCDWPKNL